jgi:putative transposase
MNSNIKQGDSPHSTNLASLNSVNEGQSLNKRLVGTEGAANLISECGVRNAEAIKIPAKQAAEHFKVSIRTIERWCFAEKLKYEFQINNRGGKGGQVLMVWVDPNAECGVRIAESKTEILRSAQNDIKENQNDKKRHKVHRGEPGVYVVTPMKNGLPIIEIQTGCHQGIGISGPTIHANRVCDPLPPEQEDGRECVASMVPTPATIETRENYSGDPLGQCAPATQWNLPAIINDTKRIPARCNRIGNLKFAVIQKFNEELTKKDPNLPLFKNGNGHRSKTKRIQKLLDLYNSGILLPEIYKELKSISCATLYNWIQLHKQGGIDGLVPQHGRAGISKITEHEKNLVLTLLLHQNRLKTAYAITLAKEYLKRKDFESPSSPATLRRFVDQFKNEHYDLWILRREGEKALNDKVLPYTERDPNLLEVGDGLVGDGTRLNFLQVIHPITGKPCRAALVLFWDWRSSYPLGWEIMTEENIQCVASALRNAILALGKIPKWIYLDNGKAFKAKIFTEDIDFEDGELPGMFARLNINYHFAQPYNAQSKPIERIFGILNEQLERLIPSYTGGSIEDKPAWTKRNEKLARAAHNPYVPTVQETNDLIRAWRDRYAERPSRGRDGLRPIDIFNEGKGPGVDPNELTYLMMDREIKNIHRNGITWLGWHWYNEALYGLKDKVVIRYSLSDLSQIYIFHKNEFLCTAKPIEKVNPMASESENPKDMEAVKEGFRLKKRVKNMTRNLSDLLETKGASQIDWSRTRTLEIAETIQKIEEAKKPRVVNISPFAGTPEPELPVKEENKPLRFDSALARYKYHLNGGVYNGPEMDRQFIDDFRSGKIEPGLWEALYAEKEHLESKEVKNERKVCHY